MGSSSAVLHGDTGSRPSPQLLQADIAIAGGGLAGSAAAAMLGRRGYDVVLVDPHPVYPPDLRCEKLDGPQVRTLRGTGLAEIVLAAAAPSGELWIARRGRIVERRVESQYGILYDALVNQARRAMPPSVRFVEGKVTSIVNGPARQVLTVSTGIGICARLAVVASGLNQALRHQLGVTREDVGRGYSVTLAFDVRRRDGAAFAFPALTYYGERPTDRVAYLTLFPVPGAMRANLMVYRATSDPWLREMRDHPAATLRRTLPGLESITGPLAVEGPVGIRPADLYESRGHVQAGVVLVGDAFATSCPAAGTGASKVLTDVHQLCSEHVPRWMQTPGMGVDKIAAFYADPVKLACDRHSMRKAFRLRSDTIREGVLPDVRRWGQFRKAIARSRGEALLQRLHLRAAGPARAPVEGRP